MNIQEMAKQAGFEQVMRHRNGSSTVLPTTMFERFADLVLEEAAKVCDDIADNLLAWKDRDGAEIAISARDAIRALKGAKE